MNPTRLIYQASGETANLPEREPKTCGLCGTISPRYQDIKKVVSSGFTNFDVLQYGQDGVLCEACTWCITKREMRTRCFLAHPDGITYMDKAGIEPLLWAEKKTPFAWCVTTSYKKHLSFFATVNHDAETYTVRHDSINVQVSEKLHRPLYDCMRELYNYGFTKREIRGGDWRYREAIEYGPALWEKDSYLNPHRGSAIFEFLLYAMNPKPKENDDGKRGKGRDKKAGVDGPAKRMEEHQLGLGLTFEEDENL